jgi:hypothetical protein
MTPHPFTRAEAFVCDESATDCGTACDPIGGDMNTYRREGPGHELFNLVDVTKPITVTTAFPLDPDTGSLAAIVQTVTDASGASFSLNLTDSEMTRQKAFFNETDLFAEYGGVAHMGEGMAGGMVLALSVWTGGMNWLDSCQKSDAAQAYDCESHATYADDAMWQGAFDTDGAGAWRGPVDWKKDNSEFLSSDVTFASAAIPAAWRTQPKFDCDFAPPTNADDDGTYDCSANDYQMVVSDIRITAL